MLNFKNVYYYLLFIAINCYVMFLCFDSYYIMSHPKIVILIVGVLLVIGVVGLIVKLQEVLSPNVKLYHDSYYWLVERIGIVSLFNFPEKFLTNAEAIKRFNEIKSEIKQKKLDFFKIK